MKRRVIGVLGAVGITASMLVTGVAGTANAAPCGYYTEGTRAFYNHCGFTTVTIRVDYKWPKSDQDLCVRPGITGLIGGTEWINSAYYIGGVNC